MRASDVVINYFMPAACGFVFGDGYEDGVGKLRYEKPKEEFLAREKTFEESMKILNACVKSDYTDLKRRCPCMCILLKTSLTHARMNMRSGPISGRIHPQMHDEKTRSNT